MDQFQIIHFDQIESTNSYAIDLITNSSPIEGTVISADFQSNGKGQIGRYWHSKPEKNLLFTIIYYPIFIHAQQQFVLSQLVCLGIIKSLSLLGIEGCIKWPNDIYVEEKKLAGILIQNQIQGKSLRSCAIGIGLNVNQTVFPEDIPNPISLFQILGEPQNRTHILTDIWNQIRYYYNKAAIGHIDMIKDEYLLNMFKKDEKQLFKTDETFEGIVKGVDDNGRLILENNGRVSSYYFREIKWILE